MIFYQVIVGVHEFDPFEGFPTGIVHATLAGAWSEIGDILEGYFQEYYMKALRFYDIDVNTTSRHVLISYERIGFASTPMVASLKIEPVSVIE